MSEIGDSETRPRGQAASGGLLGGAYGLGFIGAAVFFVQHAHGFVGVVFGLLKAVIWPALVVYGLLGHLGM
jgi:hypothetical protein